MDTDNEITDATPLVDFANKVEDKSKNIIKVVGVGGGGCNAVGNMYKEGIVNVTFAVCNTDTQALAKSEVPVKIPLGELGAGGDPSVGLEEARKHTDEIKQMLSDDNSLDADAKVTILATGFDDDFETEKVPKDAIGSDEYFNNLVAKLYKPYKKKSWSINTDAFKDEEPASSDAKNENETKTEMRLCTS